MRNCVCVSVDSSCIGIEMRAEAGMGSFPHGMDPSAYIVGLSEIAESALLPKGPTTPRNGNRR